MATSITYSLPEGAWPLTQPLPYPAPFVQAPPLVPTAALDHLQLNDSSYPPQQNIMPNGNYAGGQVPSGITLQPPRPTLHPMPLPSALHTVPSSLLAPAATLSQHHPPPSPYGPPWQYHHFVQQQLAQSRLPSTMPRSSSLVPAPQVTNFIPPQIVHQLGPGITGTQEVRSAVGQRGGALPHASSVVLGKSRHHESGGAVSHITQNTSNGHRPTAATSAPPVSHISGTANQGGAFHHPGRAPPSVLAGGMRLGQPIPPSSQAFSIMEPNDTFFSFLDEDAAAGQQNKPARFPAPGQPNNFKFTTQGQRPSSSNKESNDVFLDITLEAQPSLSVGASEWAPAVLPPEGRDHSPAQAGGSSPVVSRSENGRKHWC